MGRAVASVLGGTTRPMARVLAGACRSKRRGTCGSPGGCSSGPRSRRRACSLTGASRRPWSRIDPAWADMGRAAASASPGRAWRQLVTGRSSGRRWRGPPRPCSRLPCSTPGRPIVLGQLEDAAVSDGRDRRPRRRPDASRRARGGGLALRCSAGPDPLVGRAADRRSIPTASRGPGRGRRGSAPILSILGLAAWIAFRAVPLFGLISIAVGASSGGSDERWIVGLATVVYRLIDADTGRIWRNSLFLGLCDDGPRRPDRARPLAPGEHGSACRSEGPTVALAPGHS